MPSSNARMLHFNFTSDYSLLDSLRSGCTQALTKDLGQIPLIPLPNVRWLITKICSPPLRHLVYFDAANNFCFLSSWLCQCLLQASCIACCHCTGHHSPRHICVILRLHLHRQSILKHDFQVLNIRCKRKFFCQRAGGLWLTVGSHLHLRLDKYQLFSNVILRLHQCLRKQIVKKLRVFAFITVASKIIHSTPVFHNTHSRRVGGRCLSRAYSFSLISDYLIPGSTEADQDSMFRYVAHVDEVELLTYPSPQFVHTRVPLNELFTFLPLSHARKIATKHEISAGSRCTTAQLRMLVENHSCTQCHTLITVFSIELTPRKLTARRAAKFKTTKGPQTNQKMPQMPEFPLHPADYNLMHTILTNICNKMKSANLEEAGCAVCGELKPIGTLTHLKGIKNLLNVVEAQGVTRMERKSKACPIREYLGPVLDHSCSQVCDSCRKDIRKGKIPRLALANNLWIGRVPEVLKNLRYVEKILVARVRHTCAYVKVASGMRKMTANVVAFESPTPKIYTVLPPPRDDIDDVLAILFTGPSKPTSEDFARTPFLVRRNAVINALNWLKLNHADYADIEVSEKKYEAVSRRYATCICRVP